MLIDLSTQNLLRNKLIDDSDEKAQSTLNSGSKEHNKLNLRNGRQNKNVKLAANENSISVDPFDEDAAANLYNNNPNKDRHVGRLLLFSNSWVNLPNYRNKQDRRRNSYSRNRQNEAANSIDLDEALSNDPYSKTSYYLRENGATREKKASNFLSKEDSIDKRDHFGSPESDNGTNYTRTLKTELKQNVERVREMKRQNSKQSLRDEDSLIESPQEQSATQKLSSSNLNNTKKKKANAKLHVTEARSQHSVSQPRVEIQSKMDFINSLFSQLNCDDEEQSNPKKESRSSYLIESKSMKTTKSPNKSRISEKGGSLAKKEQSDRVEELEDNYVYREDKLNKKIIKTKNQDEEEKRAFGRNGSLQKKINLKESSAQTKKVQKQSRRLNGEEEEAEDKEEDECSNVDNLKNEQILQNYKNARDLELVSPKTQLKEFGNSQYYSNADLRTPTGNEIRSIKVKHQHQKGSLPEDYLEETDQKRQYSKNKPKYHENQGDDLAEEPQNRDFISKNLRKSYKPPLPQPKEGRNKLVDEDWFNNSDNEVEKHTQSRASHQRSSTNSNRPKKDYIAINKEKLKSSARKLSKNYDRLLKNLDQDLKPFVKVLSEQANQTVRTFKSMKSNKDSGQKSLSHISSPLKPSNNLSSPNNYVSSASSKNNRRKNQDLDGSVSQSVVHDRSYEQICQTFTETANNMKHFESGI